jgi:hypothetical protein
MNKYLLANVIASYFFGRVIVPEHGTDDTFGFTGRIEKAEQQISVFFRDGKVYVEQYVTFDDGNYIEPDFIINGDNAEAVGAWVKGRQELDALF